MNVYNTPEETAFIESTYPQTEKISVDVAIMERAQNVYTIPCDMGWSDLGTWTSLHAESAKDNNQNALVSKTIFTEDTYNSLILANPEKLVVVRGLSDFIIVDTDDCLLIYPKSEEQSIKELKEKLRLSGFDQ
jgi:mannose-1-phosphate guanylyltransferase